MTARTYLDHAATTPLDARVADCMAETLVKTWGNPSSRYAEGRAARKVLDEARRQLAGALHASAGEVVFTSGGSEANNLAIRSVVQRERAAGRRPHVVTTAIEHHAVLHTVQQMEREGWCTADYLPVDTEGHIAAASIAAAVTPETVLVSVMHANNEIGTVLPVAEITRIVKGLQPAALVHTDAVQTLGTLAIDFDAMGVDFLTLSAHKFHGPKGAGALLIRSGLKLPPQITGGGQENERRAGTENVAAIAGMALALTQTVSERDTSAGHCAALRDLLIAELPRRVDGLHLNGPLDGARRLPNNANFSIEGIDIATLLMFLDLEGIAASSGSACTSGSLEPSHVLLATGRPPHLARNSLRLTVGRDNTEAETCRAIDVIAEGIKRLRRLTG